MNTCIRSQRNLKKLTKSHPGSAVAVLWCPCKKDIEGLELADSAAKEATTLPQVINVSPCQDTVKKHIKHQLSDTISATPPSHILDRLMGFYNPPATYKALSKLTRPDATAVAQIRSGHCPLNTYLYRFKASDTPNCELCRKHEDVCHLLTTCKKFVGIRRTLFNTARKKKIRTNGTQLLTNQELFKDLGNFVRQSFWFYKARHQHFFKA